MRDVSSSLRLAFAGSPEVALPTLEALVGSRHEVVVAVSRADSPKGRRGVLTPTPVAARAAELGIPVVKADRLDEAATAAICEFEPDLGVIVAYGGMVREPLLSTPRLGWINLHFSLLPRWRGAAPVERAILAGDTVTGVCVMAVDEQLDTGDVYARAEVPIDPETTADELRAELVEVGTRLLVDTLGSGLPEPTPQVGEPTYAHKIDPAELRIDWSRPAEEIHRLIRIGGAWTTFRGSRIKIHRARLTDGELVPTEVQPEGRPRMSYEAWRNGARPAPDERFE